MKKILVIHNRYQNIGGEDIAVDNEIALLKEKFEVKELFFDNYLGSIWNFLILFFTSINNKSVKELDIIYTNFSPDIVYIHNTWFNASLGIFNYLKNKNVQILLKLHNFRYDCTKSFTAKKHLQNKTVCEACGFKKKRFQYFNKYFNESYLKSIFVFLYGRKYVKIIFESSFHLAVLTNFHRDRLIKLGVEENRVSVIPNYIYPKNNSVSKPSSIDLVYAGRISEEKGVEELVKEFIRLDIKGINLQIIGTGPLLNYLLKKYNKDNVYFHGQLSNNETNKIICNASGIVTATKLFEGQPTLLFEAALQKVPAIFPKTGGLNEFFPKNYQLSFNQFQYDDLGKKIKFLFLNLENSKKIGIQNFDFIEKNYSKEKIMSQYIKLFNLKI